jgi:adenosylmethionine-8-amino-7-oxononanoate aminotransferase
MSRVHFTPGGSEAVETALKLALQYHWVRGDRDRRTVVCRRGAYHGVTFGAMNCDGGYYSTRNDIYLGDTRFGVVAEGPATGEGWGRGARHAAGAAEFARTIEEAGPDTVAAVIVDPCATASGVAAAPAEDLRALRALCDEHGILLIVDEVITGFCRTGEMFASGLYDVRPDLMPLSKALSSGYMPIGATLVADTVVDTIAAADAEDAVFAHGHTYGAHPVACAVALENIRILQEEQLAERAARMGAYLRDGLLTLAGHDSYVDARGVGMLNGLEVLGSDEAAGSFGTAVDACRWLRLRLRDLGSRHADRAPRLGVPAGAAARHHRGRGRPPGRDPRQGLRDLEARR